MRRLCVLMTIMTIASAAAGFAAQVNDDPSVSGTTGLFVVPRAGTLEPGTFALGVHFPVLVHEEGDSKVSALAVSVGYGLGERVEAFLSFEPYIDIDRRFTAENALLPHVLTTGLALNGHPFAHSESHSGIGDLRVGAKLKMVGHSDSYDGIALAGHVKIPTADNDSGIGTGKVDFGFDLIGSAEISEFLGWNAFVGYTVRGEPDLLTTLGPLQVRSSEISNELRYGTGVHFPTRSAFQVILEGFGIAHAGDASASFYGMDDLAILQGGVRVTTESGLALGAAVNHNLNITNRDPEWQANPSAVEDALRSTGFLVMGSYSSSRREPTMYHGSAPMPLPPVNRMPTLTCRAERTTVRQGESVRLIADTSDPDSDAVTVTWSVSAGSINPATGNQVTWNTTGITPGSGPISAKASDGYGGTADCDLRVTIEAPPPAPQQEQVLNFACSEFRSGSLRIDNRCKAVLDDVALQLRQNPRATARITGHSDSAGSQQINDRLASERADNGRAYLVETHGLEASRINTASGGTTQPVADNSTRDGRSQNRRIEIVVTIPPR